MDDRFSHPQPSDPLSIFNARAAQPDSCGYVGGWSLRVPSPGHCPAKASKPCGTGVQLRCCPPDLECRGADDYFGCYCCLPGEDCVPRVLEKPKVCLYFVSLATISIRGVLSLPSDCPQVHCSVKEMTLNEQSNANLRPLFCHVVPDVRMVPMGHQRHL